VAQPFFLKKTQQIQQNSASLKQQKQMKLGRKKKQINKTPPTLNKKIRSNQISLAL